MDRRPGSPPITTPFISSTQLREWLSDDHEIALIDVREEGVFQKGHLFFASCIPLSRLELRVADLLPRASTRIVLCDDGDADLAPKAARRLSDFGYTNVHILEGGTRNWKQTGGEIFAGVNVPSKAFGEFVEHEYDTPRVPAEELKAWFDEGRDLVVVDSRPFDEYRRMNIPNGINVPGAELAYRIHDLAPDPSTLVVVNCAGRTRSIIGAQSLINAGIPNPVVALKDGTMGWELAGFGCERGQDRTAPEPSDDALERARNAAVRVRKRFDVPLLDREQVQSWLGDDRRTTYILDVRDAAEFEAGHLPGSRHAPGGQLVQATDEYMPVRNARIVLVDDTEVRASMTASWLVQMGWPEVYVLKGGIGAEGLETGSRVPRVLGMPEPWPVNPKALMRAIAQGLSLAVLDLSDSKTHRDGHVPGAYWGIRSRIEEAAQAMQRVETVVLTSGDGMLARMALPEARWAFPDTEILHLEGGNEAWLAAGLPVREGIEKPTTTVDDVWYKPYDHDSDAATIRQHMKDYLSWETALIEQIGRENAVAFRRFD